jgi:dihydroorotate dehydrogenase subfamily 1
MRKKMNIEKIKIADKEVSPFTIPSGIITTEPSSIERIAKEIPEIGIITTKSIGPNQKPGNREPILAQYAPGSFVNAVGLTNPGAEEFAKKLSKINFPKNKFLLTSIFGKDKDEFLQVAKILEPFSDGFELNLSCPHAKGYGMQLGQDKDTVAEIVRQISNNTNKPLFAKLTPNAPNIGDIAKIAIENGAYGITAINTVGPGYHSNDGNPILTNKVGGMSGAGILPIGLKCVREIRQAVGNEPLIIGMGGIKNAQDVIEYKAAGANAFGIGSALYMMTEKRIKQYFSELISDLENNTNFAEKLMINQNMKYQKITIDELVNVGCDFKVIRTNYKMNNSKAGQFVFAWIPNIGEKPFSIMDNKPLTLGILERGEFTKAITSLKKGDSFYIRGPYGNSIPDLKEKRIGLVGGGCGIAGLYLIAKQLYKNNMLDIFLAAKDKKHIPYTKEFKKFGNVHIITEDGSLGEKGLVTDLLKDYFDFNTKSGADYFFNCGSKNMTDAIIPIQMQYTSPEKIFSSLDYMTRCGVGICGSCADEKGLRTCVEGPFMNNR